MITPIALRVPALSANSALRGRGLPVNVPMRPTSRVLQNPRSPAQLSLFAERR